MRSSRERYRLAREHVNQTCGSRKRTLIAFISTRLQPYKTGPDMSGDRPGAAAMHNQPGSNPNSAQIGPGRRVLGFAFGKAMAFTYAVIVSVVANIVFDLVREPPSHTAPGDATAKTAVKRIGSTVARTALPAAAPVATVRVRPIETAPPAPPPTSDAPHPGPGSGGLY
jgi:hypothetical protein